MSSEPIKIHQPCEACGSSDALSEWEDHTYCFACEKRTWLVPWENKESKQVKQEVVPNIFDDTKVGPIKDRGITKDTTKHYDVRLTVERGVITEHYYPYHNSDGDLIAYKQRIVNGKRFTWQGNKEPVGLFGQDKFTSGGKYVTICEGEIDTLAAFQMNGSRFPHVGVPSSSDAYKMCKKQMEWLDSFDNIIICFDNDDPGEKAAKLVASLFPKKAKVVKLKLNDVSDYLTSHKEQEFCQAWWQAEQYKPDDILSGADTMWEIIQKPRTESMILYPWDKLNKATYGIRPSEFVIITAGSGMGKTQVLREVTYHALMTTEHNIGLVYLEETAWETARGVLSVHLDKPTHLPDTHVADDELLEANLATWGTNRLFTLGDRWRDNNIDYICDKVKFLARGLDCKLIILDHISFMVSDQAGDERKMLDEIAHKLKALTVELDIALIAVCHSKRQSTKPLEEGGFTSLSDLRGTAGLGQLANIVLGLERNGQAEDERERNTTLIRVLKNRFSGITGPTSKVYYDQFTSRLTEIKEEESEG